MADKFTNFFHRHRVYLFQELLLPTYIPYVDDVGWNNPSIMLEFSEVFSMKNED